jgi:hypothetical protein
MITFVKSMCKCKECIDQYRAMYGNYVDIYIQDRESKYGVYSGIATMIVRIHFSIAEMG